MASRLTPEELAARIPKGSLSRFERPDGSVAEWLPVTPFDSGRKLLVLDRAGRWAWIAGGTAAGELYAFDEPALIGALPLLELDLGSLAEQLVPVAAILGVPVEGLIPSLPGPELVEYALGMRSNYWIEKALAWAERPDVTQTPSAALQALVDDSLVRQDLRHRAQRLIGL